MTTLREDAAMSDLCASHERKHTDYSYRLPTAPRIVVPPPTINTDMPGLSVGTAFPGDVDLSFLKELNLQDIVQKNTLMDWAYERRRQAQMMLPWLYLGPMVAAKDKTFLTREGITMVLAVRAQPNSMTGAIKASQETCAEVATVDVPTFHELIGRFDETTKMINTHMMRYRQHTLETNGQAVLGKALVFCESGNEKSAAVVAAYMMQTLDDFDHVKAMQVCQAQRFCVNFDDTLKNILQSYWDILQARRSVARFETMHIQQNGQANGYTHAPKNLLGFTENVMHVPDYTTTKLKRTIDNTLDDDDMDMDGGIDPSDALRFAGRDSTPFQSRDN